MAHVTKFTRATCGLMTRHYERYKDSEHPDMVKYKNQDIDSERTHLNYNLAPDRDQLDYMNKRLENVHCLNRADVKVMCDWVVTAPKELPEEHQKEFFSVCYDHLSEKYGEQNVISAYVHMDESQPHMHFAFVPVSIDSKKNIEKVSAKDVLTRAHLKNFHPELQKVVNDWIKDKGYGIECNVLNGATEGGNKTVDELKHESLKKSLDKLEQDKRDYQMEHIDPLHREKDKLTREVAKLSSERTQLHDDIDTLKTDKEAAENELKAVKDDVNIANDQLEQVLNLKLKASEIKQPFFNRGDTVTYNKTMVNSIRGIGQEARDVLFKAQNKERDNKERENELKALQREIAPLHAEARSKRDEAQRWHDNLKGYIMGTAKNLAAKMIDDRTERLEELCSSVMLPNGQSVLQRFNEQEQERLNKEYEKSISETLRQGERFKDSLGEDFDFER